jgi:hypothetical protein
MSQTIGDAVGQLELEVLSAPAIVQSGEETPIEIALNNRGESALVVNRRLGMGYPDSTERDLYCEIQTEDGQRYLAYQAYAVDYHRKSLSEDFFPTLQPGESLRKVFDLQAWYRLLQPGVYVVRLIYAPEPYPPYPDAVRGPIISSPLSITVHA